MQWMIVGHAKLRSKVSANSQEDAGLLAEAARIMGNPDAVLAKYEQAVLA